MFVVDRCHRSRAVETPDKYERDWKYLNYTFTKSTFVVTEKLTNGGLVTPTSDGQKEVVGRQGQRKISFKSTVIPVTNTYNICKWLRKIS